jgi:uncharacterized protein DUF4214
MAEIQHVDQLLELNDTTFIEAVYRTLLGRDPDAAGLHHYSHHLRSGYGKISMLIEVAASSEAKSLGKYLPGLVEAIDAERRAGYFIRGSRIKRQQAERQLNQIENEVGRAIQELKDFELETSERLKSIEEAIHVLRNAVQTLKDSGAQLQEPRELKTVASSDEERLASEQTYDTSTLPPVAKQILKDLSEAIEESGKVISTSAPTTISGKVDASRN